MTDEENIWKVLYNRAVDISLIISYMRDLMWDIVEKINTYRNMHKLGQEELPCEEENGVESAQ